jgi:hypothetical protein
MERPTVFWINRINVKMSILTEAIYRSSAISIKSPVTFFAEIEKSVLKFMWRHKGLQIVKAILSKRSSAGGITYLTSISITEPQ